MKLLSCDQVAERLSVSSSTLRKLTYAGKIAAVWVGGQLRYREGEVEDFLTRNKVAPRDPNKCFRIR
ncbi:helix-turn-helix domain-containing protein [bacterium]|nr:helix-turn-helix domain-containing protein [bacterium]